jgi:hypothetical protein
MNEMISAGPDGPTIVRNGSAIEIQFPNYAVRLDASGQEPELGGCLEKLSRAQEHLHTLDSELRTFFDSDPYGAIGEIEGKESWYVFRVKTRREPPPRIGVLLGEYVHQVRSAFDHFAWALARLHYGKGDPPSLVGFPLETSRTNFQKKAQHRLRGHIDPGWVAIIEAMQPYGANDHPLAILERFWNRDKHQLLIPVPVSETLHLGHMQCKAYADSCTITERRPTTGVSLEDHAELGRVKVQATGSNPCVDMYVLTPAKIRSQGGIGFFWDIIPAEFTLRVVMSVFPAGAAAAAAAALTPGGLLLNRIYQTVVSTLADDNVARSRGFYIPDAKWREPMP